MSTRNDHPTKPTSEKVFMAVPGAEPLRDAYLWPIDRIVGYDEQPREYFDDKEINDLAASIKRKSDKRKGVAETGFIHPILARWEHGAVLEGGTIKKNARVIIIAGEKRFHGAKRAGLTKVPVNIVDEDEDEAYEDALVENILRGDMTPSELGRAFLSVMNLHGFKKYTQLARHLYSDTSRADYIRGYVNGLALGDDAAALVSRKKDSAVAARRISTIKDLDKRRELIQFMQNGGTVRQLEVKIKAYRQEQSQNKGDGADASSAGPPSPTSTKLGTPKTPGMITLPRFSLDEAFNVIERHASETYRAMQPPVTLTKKDRTRLLKRTQTMQAILGDIEEFLTSK